MTGPAPPAPERLVSPDAFRGLAIAGMILVGKPPWTSSLVDWG